MPDAVVNLTNVPTQERVPVRYVDGDGDGKFAQAVSMEASEVHIGSIGGHGVTVDTEFSRPADTTAYAVNDVVGPSVTGLIPFTNIARANGLPFYIVKARLMTNQSTNVAQFRLHLYKNNTPIAIADNAPFQLLWANRLVYVGFIDFEAMTTGGSGSDCATSLNKDIRLHVCPSQDSRNLYGILATKTAFTPANGQFFLLALSAEQD